MGMFMLTERPLTLTLLLLPDTMNSDASLKRAFIHFWPPYMTAYFGCTMLYPPLPPYVFPFTINHDHSVAFLMAHRPRAL